jgi:hypothetical protein
VLGYATMRDTTRRCAEVLESKRFGTRKPERFTRCACNAFGTLLLGLKRLPQRLSKPLKQAFGAPQTFKPPPFSITTQPTPISKPTKVANLPQRRSLAQVLKCDPPNPSKMHLTSSIYTILLLSLALLTLATNEAQKPLHEEVDEGAERNSPMKKLLDSWNPKKGKCYPSGPAFAADLEAYDCETGVPILSKWEEEYYEKKRKEKEEERKQRRKENI